MLFQMTSNCNGWAGFVTGLNKNINLNRVPYVVQNQNDQNNSPNNIRMWYHII